MNYHYLFLIFIWSKMLASVGCIDSSRHLTQPNDDKSYRVVSRRIGNHDMPCPCPCEKLSLDRGQCLECGHRHVMSAMHIVRYDRTHDYNK